MWVKYSLISNFAKTGNTDTMILIIQGRLPHYRRDFFNALCDVDKVTVAHSGKPVSKLGDRFAEIILPQIRVGSFRLQRGLFDLIESSRPNTIISMFDIRWLNSVRAMYYYDRQVHWVWWGLDRGKSLLALRVKLAIAQRPNPIVFYNNASRARFSDYIADSDKMFVANNTSHVPQRIKAYNSAIKNRFINVGSLDARKQNDVTIRAFANVIHATNADICLTFIGGGPERSKLQALAYALGIGDRVELLGEINNSDLLSRYYAEAYASISFGQAGLAVLQSMAFGVPFVTKRDAVSGGEKFNIVDGVNGYLCEDAQSAVESIMRNLIASPNVARQLGRAAYEYYSTDATVENMVANFQDAITHAKKINASRLC